MLRLELLQYMCTGELTALSIVIKWIFERLHLASIETSNVKRLKSHTVSTGSEVSEASEARFLLGPFKTQVWDPPLKGEQGTKTF